MPDWEADLTPEEREGFLAEQARQRRSLPRKEACEACGCILTPSEQEIGRCDVCFVAFMNDSGVTPLGR